MDTQFPLSDTCVHPSGCTHRVDMCIDVCVDMCTDAGTQTICMDLHRHVLGSVQNL